MSSKTRFAAALICGVAVVAVIWGVSQFLTSTGVQQLPAPQSTAVPSPTPDPAQQAADALAGTNEALTLDFLRFCEAQSPGLCSQMAAKLAAGETYQDRWFWELSQKTLHYYQALYQQPMAENVHDTGRTGLPVSLAFTGDVNFADDWYNMRHYAKTGGIPDCFGESLLQRMQGADVLLCNNEFAFSDRGSPMPGKQFTFRAKTANVEMWQQLGADIVGLANNHCFDYGEEAFLDTLSTLQSAGIPYVGAGANSEEAATAQFFLAGGMKIGYVACTRAEKYILTPEAGPDSPGVLRCYEPEAALEAIRQAKAQCDYLVVYVHWGTEGTTVLERAQTDLATQFQQAGADLIVGAHPHVLQGAGWREDAPVFYSLGNFWFNMETLDSALLEVELSGPSAAQAQARLLPCIQTGGRTSLVEDEAEKQRILNELNAVMESGFFDKNGVLQQKEHGQTV